MSIQDWSEDIVLVDLPEESELFDELKRILKMAQDEVKKDIVIDFSAVSIMTTNSLFILLRIGKSLIANECRLLLCSISPETKRIFTITGLEEIFEIMDDKFVALAALQIS